MKKYISMIVASLMAVSCVDTIILPDDMTVDEDFWKKKGDVELMVNGAYVSMIDDNVMARLLVWGGLRSDELLPNTSLTGTLMEDLRDINLANIQTDNQFASWASIYTVINNCNIVLERAAAVMDEDPSYTNGDYLAHCSQMLALRSLCYFYLVRNFRDVPYTSTAYMLSSQDPNIPQSAPSEVLQHCIDDLLEAEKNAVSATAYTDWRKVGYFTRDAIQALLADIYLWRGSVMHSAADYEQAVAYCNKVIASKQSQHHMTGGEFEEKDYWLADGRTTFRDVFVYQNAEESILELQVNTNDRKQALCQYYNRVASGNAAPYFYASNIFKYGSESQVFKEPVVTDWRGLMSTYNEDKTVGDFTGVEIRKYVSDNRNYMPSTTEASPETKTRAYNATGYHQNYIVYRLTDVMLMKAEALTGLAMLGTGSDEGVAVEDFVPANGVSPYLEEAFNMVRIVNARSLENESDSLKWTAKYQTTAAMEELVLNERLRELCFEGKRWYDLLRYNYRHVKGVDYTTTLADQDERGVAFVSTYKAMLDQMKRKLSGMGDAVASKMSTEPRLYLPVSETDVKICPALKQMPTYSSDKTISKDY
jgi:hypothetical protein